MNGLESLLGGDVEKPYSRPLVEAFETMASALVIAAKALPPGDERAACMVALEVWQNTRIYYNLDRSLR